MTSVTPQVVTTAEERRAFFDGLAAVRDRVVPLLGAGLAASAGAPSSAALVSALQQAAGEEVRAEDLFDAADRLAEAFGEAWVQDQVSAVVRAADLHPTAVLLALVRTSSRLILTTNYDLAVEDAASEARLRVETLTLDDIARALEPTVDTLRVLHLHGVAHRPDTMVLTRASYHAALADERLQHVMRALALGHRLLLLGQALDEREQHLRRDLLWASHVIAKSALATAPAEHLLLTGRRDAAADAALATRAGELHERAGVQLLAFDDPLQGYRFVNAAAHVLGGPAVADRADLAPRIGTEQIDACYLPLTVAPAKQIATAGGRGAHRAWTWREGEVRADDLERRERRLLLLGGGGYGKSQELLQMARRSGRSALYLRLGAVRSPQPGQDPAAVFVHWMRNALSVHADTPRLTLQRLREQAFVLLLDGFDEIPTPDRSDVATVLNEVVAAFPQHRWVVTSRQLPEDLPALDGFTAWAMLPDYDWLTRYAAHRGVPIEDLNAILSRAPGIGELATIPIYAAAVVQHAMDRRPLPPTARELALQIADAHLDDGGRIAAAPDVVRCWLNRVALHLQLLGVHEIGVAELLDLQHHEDLPGLAPNESLLAELATRALLVEEGGVARFPANVVQEARAARALRDAGEAGLATLQQVVTVIVPGSHRPGGGVHAVRAGWSNTLMLLLADAPSAWWGVIRAADPVLAARLTTATAPREDRHAAIWTLWNTYRNRRIWLDRGYSADHQSDAGALATLLRAGAPDGFEREVLHAAVDEDPTRRGNALEVLPVLVHRGAALPLVRTAIRDEHPVVRRRAAVAAYLLELHELVDDLLTQAAVDDDEMARETLTDFAFDLAPAQERIALVHRVNPRVTGRVLTTLARLVPRAELLTAVRAGELDAALLDELTEVHRPVGTAAEWTAAEVLTLAHITAEREDTLLGQSGVEQILHRHVRICLAAWLAHPETGHNERQWDLWHLLSPCDEPELEQLAAVLAGPVDDVVPQLAPELATDPADPSMVDVVRHVVAAALDARRQPPPAAPDRRARGRTLVDMVRDGDRDAALRRSSPREDTEPLPAHVTDTLREWAADLWQQRLVQGQLVPPLDAPAQDMAWLRSLQWAAWADVPLPVEDWVALAQAVLHLHSDRLVPWLRRQASGHAWKTLRPRLADWPARDVLAVPRLFDAWPQGLPELVLQRLENADLSDDERLAAAAAVLDAGHEPAIHAWLPSPSPEWARPLLVRLGDCAAEASLIAELAAAPHTWSRWYAVSETQWMHQVRCAESADALQELVRTLLRANCEMHEIEAVFRALERCAGAEVLRRYDDLVADPSIPSGRYLHYHRQRVLDAAAEQRARAELGGATQTARLVQRLIPRPDRAAPGAE